MLKNNIYCCKLPSFCWAICILLLANACTSNKSDNSNVFDPIDALTHDQQEVIGQIILEVNNSGRRTADLEVLSEVELLISLREKFGIPASKEMYSSKLNVNNIILYISNLDSINKHSVLRFPASSYEYLGRLNHNLINYELSVTNNI